MILNRLIRLSISVTQKFSMVYNKQSNLYNFSVEKNWSKYEIVYFPHKGIWYGNLFLKNHFHSSEPENPFHKSKILHFSLSEDKNLIKSSIDYYNENNIPYADWSEVSSLTKKQMIFMSKKIFFLETKIN